MLGLDAKEIAGGKVVDGPDAGGEVAGLLIEAIGEVVGFEVTVSVADDPPNEGKHCPGQEEARTKRKNGISAKRRRWKHLQILSRQLSSIVLPLHKACKPSIMSIQMLIFCCKK